jgi:hypothetical protein
VEYVQSGTVALQDAKTLQKKTWKWMCCAIILLLVTAAVIIIVVSAYACTQSGGGRLRSRHAGGSAHLCLQAQC